MHIFNHVDICNKLIFEMFEKRRVRKFSHKFVAGTMKKLPVTTPYTLISGPRGEVFNLCAKHGLEFLLRVLPMKHV